MQLLHKYDIWVLVKKAKLYNVTTINENCIILTVLMSKQRFYKVYKPSVNKINNHLPCSHAFIRLEYSWKRPFRENTENTHEFLFQLLSKPCFKIFQKWTATLFPDIRPASASAHEEGRKKTKQNYWLQ